ncbi:MAG: hypothetical protein AAFR61_04130 [Bacteroidota bacterium]
MNVFFEAIFSSANLPYTILLIIVILYWMMVFIGTMDMEFLDFDVDVDMDLDVDVDVDLDVDVDVDAEVDTDLEAGGGSPAVWLSFLSFFNLGKIPFMLFISFLILSMWAIGVYANHQFGYLGNWFALAFFLPNILLSLFVTKVVSTPFKGMFDRLDQQAMRRKDLVGKICKITIAVKPGMKGQGHILFEGNEFLFTVISEEEEIIPKGAQALLVEYNPETELFLVTPFEV